MTRALPHGATSRATGEVGAYRDGDDLTTLQRLYDTALERSATAEDRSFQRYLAVLIQAP